MKKFIFCDIDSTLHPYTNILKKSIEELYGIKIQYNNINEYHLEEIPGSNLSPEQIGEAIELTNSKDYIKDMKPYAHAKDVIDFYKSKGYKVNYLTARHKTAYPYLMDWMIEYGFINKNQKNLPMGSSDLFCFDANYIKQRSVGSQKIEFASLISKDKISILIDDSPDVLKLASYTPNILPATILHPWNKSTVDEFQIPSAKNWMKLSGELSKVYGLPLYVNHGKAIYNYS